MILGIVVGVIGIFGVSINYFIYKKLLNKGKMKYGSDIVQLAKEITGIKAIFVEEKGNVIGI